MRKTVCVDLDGVLATYDHWRGVDHFGDPVPGAVEWTKRLAKTYEIVIHTCRVNPSLNLLPVDVLVSKVEDWLNAHGFAFDYIWHGVGKPLAIAYIDDRAVHCTGPESFEAIMTTVAGFRKKRSVMRGVT